MNTEIASTKNCIKGDIRCSACFQKTYRTLFSKFDSKPSLQEEFFVFLNDTFEKNRHLNAPQIQRILNRHFCSLIHSHDPFEKEKKQSNLIAMELYDQWKPKVFSSNDSFNLALKLSIAGNIMDYGANNDFDINETIEEVLKSKFAIDHSSELKSAVDKAERILYLGDNAGEIVFDRLFIETIGKKLIFAVKDSPVLNDATLMDAHETGIDKVANVISNGYDAPSTVLEHTSREFKDAYQSADLIISKGQGNFEGLIAERDTRIFFLLMAKCDVIADLLHVKKGSFIIYNQTILK
jgi:hypothetical protein